jgi:hypothetical protein
VICARPRNARASVIAESIVNTLIDNLRELHDEYVDAVNHAVAENRPDLVALYEDDYAADAIDLMSTVLPRAA